LKRRTRRKPIYSFSKEFATVIADGDINKYELEMLKKWMDENEQLKETYSFKEIFKVVVNAISKGKIDSDEYKFLLKHFKEFLKLE